MAFEQKDNSGALFRNDRRERETQPEFTGKGLIDGVEHYISAWVKEGKGGKFFSLAFTPVDQARSGGNSRNSQNSRDSGDIPF